MPVRPKIEADFKREPGFAVQRAGNQHGVLGGKDPAVLVRNREARMRYSISKTLTISMESKNVTQK